MFGIYICLMSLDLFALFLHLFILLDYYCAPESINPVNAYIYPTPVSNFLAHSSLDPTPASI